MDNYRCDLNLISYLEIVNLLPFSVFGMFYQPYLRLEKIHILSVVVSMLLYVMMAGVGVLILSISYILSMGFNNIAYITQ